MEQFSTLVTKPKNDLTFALQLYISTKPNDLPTNFQSQKSVLLDQWLTKKNILCWYPFLESFCKQPSLINS